jgi:CheY-like chemotaxis protein
MHVIFVDDNAAFLEALADEPGLVGPEANMVPLSVGPEQPPRQIAEAVAKRAGENDAVVFINVDLKCAGHARQDQAGVEVLKFLRLTERFDESKNKAKDARCLMYSFRSVEQLLRDRPSSLMICSEGVTFEQLPSDFTELNLPALAKEKASADDLDEFLTGEFSLPDERHSWANWWAARQMTKLYYLEKVRDTPFQSKRIDGLPVPMGLSPLLRPDQDNKTISVTEMRERASDPQVRNALYLFDKSTALEDEFSDEDLSRLKRHRDTLRESDLKIGLIDDEAQQISRGPGGDIGWQHVFSHVLYDNERQVVDLLDGQHLDVRLDPTDEDCLENLLDQIRNRLDPDPLACIFLDLRLLEDSTKPGDVASVSGVEVLEEIREVEPSLPIIVTTASNKVSSFFEITKTGGDAYWVKQGMDEKRDTRETVLNYKRLVRLSKTVIGEKYQFLKRLSVHNGKIQDINSLWWEEHEWTDESKGEKIKTRGRPKVIFEILNESVSLIRSYLRKYELRKSYQDTNINEENIERVTILSIINHLGKTIEEIHRWDNVKGRANSEVIGGYPSNSGYVGRRSDWFGFKLYNAKKEASHLRTSNSLDWKKMMHFVSNLMCYIRYGPKKEFDIVKKNEGLPSIEKMRNESDLYRDMFNDLINSG